MPWNGRLTEAHVSQIYKYRHIQVYINYFYPRTHHRIPLCYFNFFLSTECTQAGLLKLASLRALPFWWDDVCNFDTLESLVVQAFNQVKSDISHCQVKSYKICILGHGKSHEI